MANAKLFNRLAALVRIDLLNARAITPFAGVAVSSTLAIIGTQAAYPLLIADQDINPLAFLPGLVATVIPMLLLFFWPVWPIHRRLHSARLGELERLDNAIARLPRPALTDPAALIEFNALLAYRREIAEVSEWPFDVSVVTRLLLYLIIPPLTWVGAAFVELLVDRAL